MTGNDHRPHDTAKTRQIQRRIFPHGHAATKFSVVFSRTATPQAVAALPLRRVSRHQVVRGGTQGSPRPLPAYSANPRAAASMRETVVIQQAAANPHAMGAKCCGSRQKAMKTRIVSVPSVSPPR